MQLSKEQAQVAFEALSAPAREERERLSAARILKKRTIMPLRWRLVALLVGESVGALLYWAIAYWFTLEPWSLWVVTVCMVTSVSIAQGRWNKRAKT
jgi:hypothetical protein